MDAFYRLPAIIRKRGQIQSSRKIAIREIWQAMNRDLLAPYWASRDPRKKNFAAYEKS